MILTLLLACASSDEADLATVTLINESPYVVWGAAADNGPWDGVEGSCTTMDLRQWYPPRPAVEGAEEFSILSPGASETWVMPVGHCVMAQLYYARADGYCADGWGGALQRDITATVTAEQLDCP